MADDGMVYEGIEGGHRWNLEGGSAIEVLDAAWSANGRLYANVKVVADDGESILGQGKIELSDVRSRTSLATELATRNGNNPQTWLDYLLNVYTLMDDLRRREREPFQPVSLADYDEPDPLRWVVDKLLPENMPSQMYGDGGQGKSTFLDHIATCIQMGLPILGFETIQGPTVILDWELDREATLRRCYAIARGMGFNKPPPIHYQSLYTPLSSHLPDLLAWCENIQPRLVCVDSMGPASGGDPNDHAKAIELMSSLRKVKSTSLVVDHQSKPSAGQSYIEKRAFGSGYKGFMTRSHWQLEMVSNTPGRASSILRHGKNNFGPKIEPLAFHTIYGLDQIRIEVADINAPEFQGSEGLPIPLRIERFLQDKPRSSMETIMEECGINSESTFDKNIGKLRQAGKLPSAKETPRSPGGGRRYELIGGKS